MHPPCPQQTLLQAFGLMTAWTHSACSSLAGGPEAACHCPHCGNQPGEQRLRMACRIVELLACLSDHPQIGDDMRQSFAELHHSWGQLLPRLQAGLGLEALLPH